MQIINSVSGYFPMELVWAGCQGSRVNIGSGYGLMPSGNMP